MNATVKRSVIFIIHLWLKIAAIGADIPCAARQMSNKSVICVCNSTYCDTITREEPKTGQYVVYSSSKAGARFEKSFGVFQNSADDVKADLTLEINPKVKFQEIIGFGAAITDAAALNWLSLDDPRLMKYFIDSYFGDEGIQYNMLRVPIGGTDFSTHEYAYNELPEGDITLRNFSLSYEDIHFKIPMIKECFAASSSFIKIIATTWSPSKWMKEHTNFSICGRLQERYYETYAIYHYKFLEEYDRHGITVWALTTSNEPANGFIPLKRFNCLGWTAYRMGLWIGIFLGPKIRASRFKDVKILAVDDQRYTIPLWFTEMVEEHPITLHYIDGVAVHFYGDLMFPPQILSMISETYPELLLLSTEACAGAFPWEKPKVDLGSWERAETYALDIITDLLYKISSWLDWNICLNEHGGPTWNQNYVDSPVIVAAQKGEFYKQPMFYVMGHFSKFVLPGSFRIEVKQIKPKETVNTVRYVAFATPRKTTVLVAYNKGDNATKLAFEIHGKRAAILLESKSISTVEFACK